MSLSVNSNLCVCTGSFHLIAFILIFWYTFLLFCRFLFIFKCMSDIMNFILFGVEFFFSLLVVFCSFQLCSEMQLNYLEIIPQISNLAFKICWGKRFLKAVFRTGLIIPNYWGTILLSTFFDILWIMMFF